MAHVESSVQQPTVRPTDDRSLLRKELGRFDTIFFLIAAIVAVDTIGAIAVGGPEAFTWLAILFVTFFVPSALISAELGAAIPEEGGAYVWVRRAFGRFAGSLTSLLYWAGIPMWLGGSVAVVAISVFERFVRDLSSLGMLAVGGGVVVAATLASVVPLSWGKWIPVSGAISQIVLLAFLTVSVLIYGAQHGVHGLSWSQFGPSQAVFIAVVPVLLYSFVGVELPASAAEEMHNPRKDIPAAIGLAGVAQALMYGVPILAVLFVLPPDQISSLHGLVDTLKTVLTVYGGQWLGWLSAAVFIWVLIASGATWIMGGGRAQAAACLDGGGPAFLGRISARSGVPVIMGWVSGAVSLLALVVNLWFTDGDAQKFFSATLTVSIAFVVLAYLLIYPAFLVLRWREPGLERPFRVPGGQRVAVVLTALSTGWSLLAVICLLWPGAGTATPDAYLPAGFEGQRAQFQALVIAPIVAVVVAVAAYHLWSARRARQM